MLRLPVLIATLILVGAGPAWAQTPPSGEAGQDLPASTLEDVVVSGQTLEERAATFVDEVAQPVRRRGLARWAGSACFGVVNFDGAAARYIADELVARADELGLPVGELDCDPNVFIIGTIDAPGVAREWVARSPDLFRPGFSGAAARPSVLESFVSSDAAVRWWHVSVPTSFDVFTGRAQPGVRLPDRPPPQIQIYSKSQQVSRVRDDLLRVMVLVDVERLGSVTIDQLCDYLLMVGYAQVDPDGDTAGYETILNLFDGPPVTGLTHWDRSYLAALYQADPDRRVSGGDQGGRLADALRRADEPVVE